MEEFLNFNFVKLEWTKNDILELETFLNSLKNSQEKCEWEQKIVNTKLPCFAIGSEKTRLIINSIFKGNYLSFLKIMPWNNHAETLINGGLICKIKEFDTLSHYLLKYAEKCDNWASCDTLKFKVKQQDKNKFLALSQKLITSPKTFVRRIGYIILFSLIKFDDCIDKIINLIQLSLNENEYYVNMCVAWLVCELFIKHKDKAMQIFNQNMLNTFTHNKAISKCCDSFRVTAQDKQMLKSLRK